MRSRKISIRESTERDTPAWAHLDLSAHDIDAYSVFIVYNVWLLGLPTMFLMLVTVYSDRRGECGPFNGEE